MVTIVNPSPLQKRKGNVELNTHLCEFSTSSVDGVLISFEDLTKLKNDQFENLPIPKFYWKMI